jgi:uncharacterized protein
MRRWAVVLLAYAAVGLLAGVVAAALWGSAWAHPDPWLSVSGEVRLLFSLSLGAVLGVGVVLLSDSLSRSPAWARTLADELAPIARSIPPELSLPLALLSALGEELLFRAALMPVLGLVGSSIVFGLLHQMRGPARLAWTLTATWMGLCLGALYVGVGSIWGPILAHAIINAMNLRMLRRREAPTATRTPLGGVLGSSLPR